MLSNSILDTLLHDGDDDTDVAAAADGDDCGDDLRIR